MEGVGKPENTLQILDKTFAYMCNCVNVVIVKQTQSTSDCTSHDHSGQNVAALPVSEVALERCSRIFRAMGDTGRFRLLARLAHNSACVGELAAAERESITTISQRLRVLRADNIVRRTRDGKHVVYALADQHMLNLVTDGLAHAAEPAPGTPSVVLSALIPPRL